MRSAAELSIADVAAAMGVDSSLVEQLEDGVVSVMQVETIAAYVAALGGHLQLVADLGPDKITTVIDYGPGDARNVA